jgi:hypothetical protein
MASNVSPLSQQEQVQRCPSSVSVESSSIPSSLIVSLACSTTSGDVDGESGNKILKRRSCSLSSESSSSFSPFSSKKFSLPFKKRRFFLIAMDDDDDDGDGDEMNVNVNRRSLSPMDGSSTTSSESAVKSDGSSSERITQGLLLLQEQQRKASVTTPTRSIVGPHMVSSSSSTANTISEGNSNSFACITPVPRTPKQNERNTIVVPKAMPQLLVCKPAEEEEEDNDATTNASSALLPGRSESSEKHPVTPLLLLSNNSNATTRSPDLVVNSNFGPMQTRWSRRSGGRSTISQASSPSRNSNSDSDSDSNGSINRHSKRLTHPRLEAPLSNGCHGQTSRTQSFCRRGPNFNGSSYCKLHYFDPRYKYKRKRNEEQHRQQEQKEESHPESNSTRSTAAAKPLEKSNNSSSSSKRVTAEKEDQPRASTRGGSRPIEPPSESSAVNNNNSSSRSRVPRDRLYRGSLFQSGEAEVRCLAISTRGKRCCYTAVDSNGNHYCHRHSSFFHKDSNEASETTLRSSNRSSGALNRADHQQLLPQPQSPAALSNLSTDLWQNRKVLVTRGPHKSRIGTVDRWRNGWVTVKLSSGGHNSNINATPVVYHNRRSYELFLV